MGYSELQSSMEEKDFVLVLKHKFSSNSCVRHYTEQDSEPWMVRVDPGQSIYKSGGFGE